MTYYKCFVRVNGELRSIDYGDPDADYNLSKVHVLRDGILKFGKWGFHFYDSLTVALQKYEIYHDIMVVMEVSVPIYSEIILNNQKYCAREIKIIGPLSGIYAEINYTAWFKDGRLHRSNAPAYFVRGFKNSHYYWYKNGFIHRDNRMPTSLVIDKNFVCAFWRGDYQPQRLWEKKEDFDSNCTVVKIKRINSIYDFQAFWFKDGVCIEKSCKTYKNISEMEEFMIQKMEIDPVKL